MPRSWIKVRGVRCDPAGLGVQAHFCGLAGLKPTSGRVPMAGAFPPAMGALAPIWAAGPLARHVEDLGLMLDVLAGPDNRDPYAVPVALGRPEEVDLRSIRVAVFSDGSNGIASPRPETAEAVTSAGRALSEAGLRVQWSKRGRRPSSARWACSRR